ncbi:MAG TPA: glycosyltransferase family 87 protein [Caulobacteraceae bacterium]|nr:glycosyltransferase family 87 protein [Caulobacteraceae bacterium]
MVFLNIPELDERLKVRALWGLALALAAIAAPQIWTLINFQPLGIDFLPLWTAGRMSWAHPDRVYDFAAVSHAQDWLLPNLKWPRPYAYPPTTLLLLATFGRLPFWPALGAWLGLGLGVFLYAGARLAQRRRGLVLVLMVLSPAALLAQLVGQSVLLAAGLTVLAMLELERRPRLSGALFAIAAAIKPQAVLLAPIGLLAGGAFEALASAAVVEAVLIGLSVLCFGPARWAEWLGSFPAFQAVIDSAPGLVAGVITPAGAAHALGLSGMIATLWRAAFALFGAVLVWRAFARPGSMQARIAALAAGSLLAAPYAMHYDGTLLVPAAVAMAVDGVEAGGWTVRMLALCAVCEVTTPGVGVLAILAFAVLSGLRTPVPRLTAEPLAA